MMSSNEKGLHRRSRRSRSARQPHFAFIRDDDLDEHDPFLPFPYSLHTMDPQVESSRVNDPDGSEPFDPNMVIHVEHTVTVESVYEEPLETDPTPRPFGDNSGFYQATVSAASQLARAILTGQIPQIEIEDADADAAGLPMTRPRNRKWIWTAALLAAANIITCMVDSMMAVMVPTIAYDLDVQGFQWLLAGPAIGAAASVLVAGQIYAVFPFRTVYTLFALLLLVGIMSPGFASSYMTMFFYSRILMGIGMAGQQLGALIFLGHNGRFMDKVRRDFFVSVSTALGFIVGPIFGAIFAHRNKFWSWGFYTAALALTFIQIAVIALLPHKFDTGLWTVGDAVILFGRRMILRVDFLGCLLGFFGLLTVLITFNLAGTWIHWSDGSLYVPLGLGALLLVLFGMQQYFKVCASNSTILFPTQYLRCFKTSVLFILTFLGSGVFQSVLAYSALYQLLTRPNPSEVATGFYLLFSMTGPYLIPLILVPLYFGGGLIKIYPRAASYGMWSVVVSGFLVLGTVILFINGPGILPGDGNGLPTIAKQFALACIGFWSAVTLPLAHQILDVFQPIDRPNPSQKHPHHNRAFILFATYLGAAVALTATGSVFMQLGPRATLSLLENHPDGYQSYNAPAANEEDAQILMLGYTFVLEGVTPALFIETIKVIEKTFEWAFAVPMAFAILMLLLSTVYLVIKLYKDGWNLVTLKEAGVPDEWRESEGRNSGGNRQASSRLQVEAGGRVIELDARRGSGHFGTGTGTGTSTTVIEGPLTPRMP
ncbi:hypothetical protein KCU88_g2404, partial [Aureobasidium melanogenum]